MVRNEPNSMYSKMKFQLETVLKKLMNLTMRGCLYFVNMLNSVNTDLIASSSSEYCIFFKAQGSLLYSQR